MNYALPIFIFFACFGTFYAIGQTTPNFAINGNAAQTNAICYRLTNNVGSQVGSIWNTAQISLTQSFESEATLYLGCATSNGCFGDSDSGADGIVFAFQPISTNIGILGGGMGIGGVEPSLCIEFDTYPNNNYNDPNYDHIRIFKNGDPDHNTPNNLSSAVGATNTNPNIEDCDEHQINVNWNAETQTLRVYFDCDLRLTYTGNIIDDIFGGDPNVYWGFTSATGGCYNEQRVCVNIPPIFNLNDTSICQGASVQLNAPQGAATYEWNPNNGLDNPNIPNPIATPNISTTYTLSLTNQCGFVNTFNINIAVLSASTNEQIATICEGEMFMVGSSFYIETGTYTETLPLPNGCDSTIITHLTVLPNTLMTIDTTICTGNTYILPDQTEVNATGTYTVTIPSILYGCDSTIIINLSVFTPNCDDSNCNTTDTYNPTTCTCENTPIPPPNCDDDNPNTTDTYNTGTCTCEHELIIIEKIIIPNIFSPNADNVNDVLKPICSNISSIYFAVYNRWGQLVFESTNMDKGWNGTFKGQMQENGVYVYILNYTTNSEPDKPKAIKGNVTLIK